MRNKALSLAACALLTFVLVWASSFEVADSRENIAVNSTKETEEIELTESDNEDVTNSTAKLVVKHNEQDTEDNSQEETEAQEEIETESEEITYQEDEEEVQSNIVVLSNEDKDLLLRISMCEAGGEDIECIASVMCVVLNRVQSESFPDSIYNVIYQSGQFTPVQTGWIQTVEPSSKCYEALDMVLNGWDETQGALYFESCSGESWHSRNLEYLFSYGSMRFYK